IAAIGAEVVAAIHASGGPRSAAVSEHEETEQLFSHGDDSRRAAGFIPNTGRLPPHCGVILTFAFDNDSLFSPSGVTILQFSTRTPSALKMPKGLSAVMFTFCKRM